LPFHDPRDDWLLVFGLLVFGLKGLPKRPTFSPIRPSDGANGSPFSIGILKTVGAEYFETSPVTDCATATNE